MLRRARDLRGDLLRPDRIGSTLKDACRPLAPRRPEVHTHDRGAIMHGVFVRVVLMSREYPPEVYGGHLSCPDSDPQRQAHAFDGTGPLEFRLHRQGKDVSAFVRREACQHLPKKQPSRLLRSRRHS